MIVLHVISGISRDSGGPCAFVAGLSCRGMSRWS